MQINVAVTKFRVTKCRYPEATDVFLEPIKYLLSRYILFVECFLSLNLNAIFTAKENDLSTWDEVHFNSHLITSPLKKRLGETSIASSAACTT